MSQHLPVKGKKPMRKQRLSPINNIASSYGIGILMLAVFAVLAWETLFQDTMNFFDDNIVRLIRYFANPVLDKIMIIMSDMGFGKSFVVIAMVTFLLLAYLKRWLEVYVLAICLGGSSLLGILLKNLFHRTRPELLPMVQTTSFSFPSLHALMAVCFYGMVAFLIARAVTSRRGRLAVTIFAVVLITAIGISRIYLEAHYPTDVIAGYTIGSAWLVFCTSLLNLKS